MDACRLLPHEIGMMRNNEEIIRRLVKSYEMMLDFYGMCLLSDTGLHGRLLPPRDFKSRYQNLLREYASKCLLEAKEYVFRMVREITQQSTHHPYPQVLV